ncbi:MAG TPA: energy transducer TonB [Gemmatimonadales bacterium]|nr:energy transducer TonB [Gemmatimonadales bacterium]
MFQRLAQARQKARRTFLSVSGLSLAAHGAVILGAGYAVATTSRADNAVKVDTTAVFLTQAAAPTTPQPVELDLPVKGFQTLVIPTEIPTNIPPVDLTERFDPRDYSGQGVEGGRSDGAEPAGSAVYSTATVQEPPALLSGPPPYPDILRAAGAHGRVMVQGIVDTAGHLEPASLKIVTSPDPVFNQPTLRWALKARFRPARLEGRPVRVLVNLPVDFSVPGG